MVLIGSGGWFFAAWAVIASAAFSLEAWVVGPGVKRTNKTILKCLVIWPIFRWPLNVTSKGFLIAVWFQAKLLYVAAGFKRERE